MRRTWMNRSRRWLVVLLITLVSALMLLAAPVKADGDTVTLTLTNGPTFTYGGTKPKFTAVVTFGTKPTANYFWQIYVQVDAGQTFGNGGSATQSSDGMTLTFTGLTPVDPISVGQHTAVARFYDPGTGITVYSAPVGFTINKATIDLACSIDSGAAFVGVGQTVHIAAQAYSGDQLPAEWQTGTYTVTFDGPTHVTYSNLTSDSNNVLTVTAPSQAGYYRLGCTFSGSASYTSSSFSDSHTFIVSAKHSLGKVELYTNPTTLVAGRSADFYVVFHPAPGLPMPTGQFSIWLDQYHTNTVTLGPTGDYLIHTSSIPVLAGVSNIEIFYLGDVNYDRASVRFPLTNPPIPSGANSGGSGSGSAGGNAQGTATAEGIPDATTTPGDETQIQKAGGTSDVLSSSPQQGNSGNSELLLLIILAVLGFVVGGVAGGAVYWVRRTSAHRSISTPMPEEWSAPSASPSSGRRNDDTLPLTPGDH